MEKDSQDFMLQIRCSTELNDQLTYYAKKVKISKSRLVRNIMESAIDDLKLLDRIGVLWMAGTARGMKEAINVKLNEEPVQQQLEL